uniref:Amiloride-sensitive sodium channel n=1 Tax=Rhabditophanes sp. KR3021 TaxID=114890 RepID=A0AC35UIK0_9BILA
MCSWNGNQCNINEDFRLHTDPQYGNCYTFNSDSAKRLISSRAGSSYGLRLMLYVNSSDYLPTTEMAGVKISIHEIGKNPYPEIFGYSGPTGAISSYGISLRKVKRLGKHGECVMQDEPLPENYIYKHYDTEGCVRSYYQASIIQTCKCADPRYPTSNNSIKICDIFNKAQKNCLLLQSLKFEKNNITSTCKPVCGQNLWTTR